MSSKWTRKKAGELVYQADLVKKEVMEKLQRLGKRVVEDLKRNRWPSVELPLRTTKNIVYDEELRQYVLGPKKSVRTLSNIRHVRPFAQLVWLAKFAKQLLESGKTSTASSIDVSS
jgi:DNA topoisomerase-6 subunit A